MTTEQEALRLAEEGERRSKILRQEPPDWSAMLRKLVAEREADRAAMRRALEALEKIMPLAKEEFGWYTNRCAGTVACDAGDASITDLRQRLEGTT